jgi:CcmD family protein
MDTRNFTYMFYGFAAAFIIIVAYVLTLVSRERKIREEIKRLRSMIESTGDRRV